MDTHERVKRAFDYVITTVYRDRPEVLRFLMTHERRDLAINRVTEQVRALEYGPRGVRFGVKQFNEIVHEAAKWFCIFARKQWDDSSLTSAERQRLLDEGSELERFEDEQKSLARELLRRPT